MRSGILVLFLSAAALSAGPQATAPDTTVLDHPLHFDVNLVQVDAVVTDAHGQRVHDLKADDFEALQDGKRQPITHFLYVPASPARPPEPVPQRPRQLAQSEVRRVFLIYVDDRVMSPNDFATMRQALRRFVDEEFQPGDVCAFYRTSGGPGAWRAFSSNPRQARAALDHMTWLRPPPVLRSPVVFNSQLNRALHALAALPGRKALVLVNSGVVWHFAAHFDTATVTLNSMARHLADEANRASVAIYSIDSRGLAVGPAMPDNWAAASEPGAPAGPNLGGQFLLKRQTSYFASQGVPTMLADMTGGLMFHDTNNLDGALHEIANDEGDYYLLGWNPGKKAFDQKGREALYHSIRIKVRNPGLNVRSRAGFFGVPETQRTRISARSRVLFDLNSPFRDEDIAVDLTASYQNSAALGPYMEALVHVSPQGIDFATDDRGCRVAHLEVVTVPQALGSDFDPAPLHGQLATLEACGATAETVLRDGFVFTARQKVPAPGPYEMHVVVRDVPPGEGPALGPKRLVTDSDPNAPHQAAHIGSASEFVNVPDSRAHGPALSGIGLRLESAPEPSGDGNAFWRPPVAGDPAIREFHAGDAISCQASLFGRDRPAAVEMNVLFEGKPLHSETLQPDGDSLHGTYHIDPNAPAGEYLLGIVAPRKDGKGNAAEEWINFQVTR